MEKRLGVTLLRRSASGSTVTAEGALVVEWARAVVEAADRLVAGVGALNASQRELAVSASRTIAEYLAPGWLVALRAQHPELVVSLSINNSATVIAQVRSRDAQLGFVEGPEVPQDLNRRRIGVDRLVVVVGQAHPWAERRGGLGLEELARTALVEREPGSGTRSFLDQLVGRTQRPAPLAELPSNGAVVASVAAGLGPAVLSIHAVRSALEAGQLLAVPVRDAVFSRDLHAVWPGSPEISGPAGWLLQTIGFDREITPAEG